MALLDRVGSILTLSHSTQANLIEDYKLFLKLETYIDEIIYACSEPQKYYKSVPRDRNLVDQAMVSALIRDFRRIVADHGDIHNNITRCEDTLREITVLIPDLVKHIKEGYLDFDEYEDTVE